MHTSSADRLAPWGRRANEERSGWGPPPDGIAICAVNISTRDDTTLSPRLSLLPILLPVQQALNNARPLSSHRRRAHTLAHNLHHQCVC